MLLAAARPCRGARPRQALKTWLRPPGLWEPACSRRAWRGESAWAASTADSSERGWRGGGASTSAGPVGIISEGRLCASWPGLRPAETAAEACSVWRPSTAGKKSAASSGRLAARRRDRSDQGRRPENARFGRLFPPRACSAPATMRPFGLPKIVRPPKGGAGPASERDAGRPHAAAGARRGPADASTGREKASVRPGLSAEGARCLVAELAARAFCFLSASDAVNVICGLLAAAAPRLQRYRRRSAGLEPGTRSSATRTC